MLKRVLAIIIFLILIFTGIKVFEKLFIVSKIQKNDEYSIAVYIANSLSEDYNKTVFEFKEDDINSNELFSMLESIFPYAFEMQFSSYSNGKIVVEIKMDNFAVQRQAMVLSKAIVTQIIDDNMSDTEKLEVIHDYLVANTKYDVEITQDSLDLKAGTQSPFTAVGALVNGRAVCAGYSRAFMLLCEQADIQAVYVSDSGMNHGWNAVCIDGEVLFIDTTYDDPVPDRGLEVSKQFFLKSPDEFRQTHIWDESFYNVLFSLTFN